MKYTIFLLCFLGFLFACSSGDLSYVKKNTWQYDSGFKIGDGDFVEFDRDSKIFKLVGDTIYFKGLPKALVTSTNKKTNEMHITSIDGTKEGLYINIEEFTK